MPEREIAVCSADEGQQAPNSCPRAPIFFLLASHGVFYMCPRIYVLYVGVAETDVVCNRAPPEGEQGLVPTPQTTGRRPHLHRGRSSHTHTVYIVQLWFKMWPFKTYVQICKCAIRFCDTYLFTRIIDCCLHSILSMCFYQSLHSQSTRLMYEHFCLRYEYIYEYTSFVTVIVTVM